MDDLINPGEFTEKELLKLVYRDLHRLKVEFEDYKKNNNMQFQIQSLEVKHINLQNELDTERKLREEAKKSNRTALYIVGFVLVCLDFVLKFIVK